MSQKTTEKESKTEVKSQIPAFPPIKDNKDYLFVTQGLMILDGHIDDESVSRPIEQILVANAGCNLHHLTLMINSEGGSVHAAFALIDIMRGSKIPIFTAGYGKILSSGLLIFMSGEPGERVLLPNTAILSHQFSSANGYQKEHDLMSGHNELVKVGKRMRKHYSDCTGLDLSIIDDELLCPSDKWMTPKEAIKYGLADRIITKIVRK